MLHKVMIPLETFSFLLCLAAMLRQFSYFLSTRETMAKIMVYFPITVDAMFLSLGWSIGLTSLAVADTENRLLVGSASLVFHVAACSLALRLVKVTTPVSPSSSSQPSHFPFIIALCLWSIAWALQVGIGHWIWEGNQPNVANMEDVSWLAMTQSVLISWSS